MNTPTSEATHSFTRRDVAAALTAFGHPIRVQTLAQMASRGEGPPFVRRGNTTFYNLADAIAWAKARPRRSRA